MSNEITYFLLGVLAALLFFAVIIWLIPTDKCTNCGQKHGVV
jgi:hypothetical protein